MSTGHSPTVRRRRLAAELRRLREDARLTCEDVALRLECSASKISRIETGRVTVSPRDVRDMLEIYGVEHAEREALVQIAREARQKGWWTAYGDVLTSPYSAYVGLEAEARSLRVYDTHLVPALLQTECYAQALFRGGLVTSTEEIQRRIAVRLERQALLTKPEPLWVWTVLDEAVLRRRVGGEEVMRDQLARLVDAAELPNVTIQVLPFSVGAHAGVDGSFTILEFPEPADPDVVYVEHMQGCAYIEREEAVRAIAQRFDHLRAAALSPDDSVALIVAEVKAL